MCVITLLNNSVTVALPLSALTVSRFLVSSSKFLVFINSSPEPVSSLESFGFLWFILLRLVTSFSNLYFEEVWIGKLNLRRNRSQPRYAHILWNIFERTKALRHSRRYTMKISGRPLSILRENNLCMTLQLRKVWRGRGGMPPAKKRKYVDCVTRLQNLANSFDEDSTDILEYLSEWIIIYNFKSILVLNFWCFTILVTKFTINFILHQYFQ